MGGKNHQPCKVYLLESTRMSRSASLTYSSLERANVALEDVLLAELEGNIGNFSPVLTNLQESEKFLRQLRADIYALRAKMDELSYEDLPTLSTTDLDSVGEELAASGCVNREAWSLVTRIMKTVGFPGILDLFVACIINIEGPTRRLKEKFEAQKASAERGKLNIVVEENRRGNFKKEFAQLYTAWEEFNRNFLASSVLSTELWYRHNDTGSILKVQTTEFVPVV